MAIRSIKLFHWSVAALLAISAAAKFVSSGGAVRLLDIANPIFGISNRAVLQGVGVLELSIALVCLSAVSQGIKTIMIASLAADFALYRLGLYLLHYTGPCNCLGDLTQRLGISQHTGDLMAKTIICYMAVGSLFALYWTGVRSKQPKAQ